MAGSEAVLERMSADKEFFVGVDSDGCVFDSMEIKHKECFCPAFINHFDLQAVSKYARETWEFVNLYSRTRGLNRFLALIRALELLDARDDVHKRNVKVPSVLNFKNWVKTETKLGIPALRKAVENGNNSDLEILYKWSVDVNKAVEKIVRNIPPFPFVKECLLEINKHADAIVVSQTPETALRREWSEHGLDRYVKEIAGQEMGTKTDQLGYAAKGKYNHKKVLMIGDAPGDLKAARDNNALYYPIIPGQEEKSWELLYKEGLDRFFGGTFEGEYEEKLIAEFFAHLPEHPPW